jgi:hypothetical protein
MINNLSEVLAKIGEEYQDNIQENSRYYYEISIAQKAANMLSRAASWRAPSIGHAKACPLDQDSLLLSVQSFTGCVIYPRHLKVL